MKIVRRLAVWGLVALVVLTMIAAVVGMTMPADHTVVRQAMYERSPAEVWHTINRFDLAPEWRSDVDSVEIESSVPLRFVEEGIHGPLPLEVREKNPEEMTLVVETYDLALPFTVVWTYQLTKTEGGTVVTVTEKSHTSNPLTRVGDSLLSEPTDEVDTYLIDLGLRFGESVTPADPAVLPTESDNTAEP